MGDSNPRASNMENEEYIKVTCLKCKASLPEEWVKDGSDDACPTCGSSGRQIEMRFNDQIRSDEIKESITGKLKDTTLSSKKKIRHEFFEGDDLRVSDGTWMKKTRIIDKRNNTYQEIVTDPRNGDVVHYCEEPLSDHFGHGSAKFNNAE